MLSHSSQRRRSWRCLRRYRQKDVRLRKFCLFLIAIEILAIIYICWQPIRFLHQAYFGWDYQFEGEESAYSIKLRLKDGEIKIYKTEKILQ